MRKIALINWWYSFYWVLDSTQTTKTELLSSYNYEKFSPWISENYSDVHYYHFDFTEQKRTVRLVGYQTNRFASFGIGCNPGKCWDLKSSLI